MTKTEKENKIEQKATVWAVKSVKKPINFDDKKIFSDKNFFDSLFPLLAKLLVFIIAISSSAFLGFSGYFFITSQKSPLFQPKNNEVKAETTNEKSNISEKLLAYSMRISEDDNAIKNNNLVNQRESTSSTMLLELEGMGYFKYINIPSELDKVKTQVKTQYEKQNIIQGIYIADGIFSDQRTYGADGEELAEGGIKRTIMKMYPILQKEGVIIESIEEYEDKGTYAVSVNGKLYQIYNAEELDPWGKSTEKLALIVNELLQKANSDEKLYRMDNGNDCRVVLLNKKLFDYLKDSKLTLYGEPY